MLNVSFNGFTGRILRITNLSAGPYGFTGKTPQGWVPQHFVSHFVHHFVHDTLSHTLLAATKHSVGGSITLSHTSSSSLAAPTCRAGVRRRRKRRAKTGPADSPSHPESSRPIPSHPESSRMKPRIPHFPAINFPAIQRRSKSLRPLRLWHFAVLSVRVAHFQQDYWSLARALPPPFLRGLRALCVRLSAYSA
jgi:hypothetical protein